MTRSTLALLALTTACVAACRTEQYALTSDDHCFANDGDASCAELYPDGSKPFCNSPAPECGAPDDGCSDVTPTMECWAPCGGDPDSLEPNECPGTSDTVGNTAGSSTSESTTETSGESSTSGTTSSDDSGSTTGAACEMNDDCPDTAAPFCDESGTCVDCSGMPDGNAACTEADAGTPVCSEGTCVQCTAGEAAACDGQTPLCGEDNTCQACTEHSHCPDTACHLDGDEVGACFDAGDVVMVGNTSQLEGAFTGAAANDDVVIVLTGSNYFGTSIDFTTSAEVAVVGDGSQNISGDRPGGLVQLGGSAIVYFSGVTIGPNGTGSGLDCSATSVWLDDSEVSGNAQLGLDISGGCEAHLRRTVVRANDAGGILVNGASLAANNSAISNNLGSNPGLQVLNSTFEVTYSTLVGNFASGGTPDTLQCTNPSGFVRNSIVMGETASSISGCNALSWDYNAVDTTGLGATNDNLGAWNSAWFSMPDSGNYHLLSAGETTFMDIAQWQNGDPLTDVDGDPIPTDMPSFPGYDQP